MKKQPIKFSEYPFIVPNEKQCIKKMEGFLAKIKECKTAEEAAKVIKKLNDFMEILDTEGLPRLTISADALKNKARVCPAKGVVSVMAARVQIPASPRKYPASKH